MSRSRRLSPRLAWTLKLFVSIALLSYIATQISLRALWEALAGADLALVGIGLALSAAGMAAATVQLRVIGEQQGIRLSSRDAFALNLSTSFYNLLLPGYIAGGVARWYRLARSHSAAQPLAALAVVLASRVVELATVLVAGLLFWAADPLARSNRLVPATFAGLLLGLILVVRVITRSGGSLGRVMPARWRDRVAAGFDAAARFREMPRSTLGRLVGASAARHLLMIGAFYCFAQALHLPLTIAVAGWARTVVALAGMLPVTVGGLGVREGSLIAVLHPYGVPAPAAAALGLLLFARELAAALAGGVIEGRTFLSLGEAGRA
jgi:uncharacterized membrane protein YbhN (UPF0104 family)